MFISLHPHFVSLLLQQILIILLLELHSTATLLSLGLDRTIPAHSRAVRSGTEDIIEYLSEELIYEDDTNLVLSVHLRGKCSIILETAKLVQSFPSEFILTTNNKKAVSLCSVTVPLRSYFIPQEPQYFLFKCLQFIH